MSGPIIRSGPSPEFSKNWDSIFGGKKPAKATAGKKAAPKSAATKSAKKKPAKKGKKK